MKQLTAEQFEALLNKIRFQKTEIEAAGCTVEQVIEGVTKMSGTCTRVAERHLQKYGEESCARLFSHD